MPKPDVIDELLKKTSWDRDLADWCFGKGPLVGKLTFNRPPKEQ